MSSEVADAGIQQQMKQVTFPSIGQRHRAAFFRAAGMVRDLLEARDAAPWDVSTSDSYERRC